MLVLQPAAWVEFRRAGSWSLEDVRVQPGQRPLSRATTRNLDSPAAQALQHNPDALRKGIESCNMLFLCLLPNLDDFQQAPQKAALIARLAKEAGVTYAVALTTLGCFFIEPELELPVKSSLFFKAHYHSKKQINFGYTNIKRRLYTTSLTAKSPFDLIDHVNIARFAAAALQNPATYHGRKLGAQARGSWLFFSFEPCLCYLSGYTDMDEFHKLMPGIATLKGFLLREAAAVKETYMS
ncbi:NmrA family protein [Nemania abortiva]|nr:NmrA family protein [Nemania abortiva]